MTLFYLRVGREPADVHHVDDEPKTKPVKQSQACHVLLFVYTLLLSLSLSLSLSCFLTFSLSLTPPSYPPSPPRSLLVQVPLLFRLDARDPLRQKKARFWRMDGPEQRRVRLCVGDTDAVRGALSMLRIIVADAAEMVVVEGKCNATIFSTFEGFTCQICRPCCGFCARAGGGRVG